MFKLPARILRRLAFMAARWAPASLPNPDEEPTDWLPPVIGTDEWPLAIMIDRGAGWYLDRR